MTSCVYVIYDSKVGIYAAPVFFQNKGAALRAWENTVNDPQTNIHKHPGDYTLFEVGTYDEQTGEIKMHDAKINLGCAVEMLNAKQ